MVICHDDQCDAVADPSGLAPVAPCDVPGTVGEPCLSVCDGFVGDNPCGMDIPGKDVSRTRCDGQREDRVPETGSSMACTATIGDQHVAYSNLDELVGIAVHDQVEACGLLLTYAPHTLITARLLLLLSDYI